MERIAKEQQEPEPRPHVLPRQQVRTRDGVNLCTDVYFPEETGAQPVVVVRTPYGRQSMFLLLLAQRLNRAGLCTVLQDSRGRYQSGGSFSLECEDEDGRDTLEWLARQPWCDGRVGLVGMSVSSLPNLLVASGRPVRGADVRAVVNVMGAVDGYRAFYRDGALVHHWALPWSTLIGRERMGRNDWQSLDWRSLFRHLPLADAVDATGGDADLWKGAVSHPAYEEAWARFSALERLQNLKVPVLHLGGWYDFLLGQTLLGYHAMLARDNRTAPNQKLILGPWNHQMFAAGSPGFGGGGNGNVPPFLELVSGWLERWLAPRPTLSRAAREIDRQPDVLLFVLREEAWIGAARFPLAEATTEDWYLTSGGRANTAAGDGCLVREPPSGTGQDSFTFDPDDPVPTVGGALWPFPAAGLVPGPADQSRVEQRPDVLVYTSPALEQDLLVIGELEVEMWAATSGLDTDFTAKLVDVDPRGISRIVQDGVVRGRFSASVREADFLLPHRPKRFRIDLQATAYRFRAGHRLRLEISSSNFPKFDRNLNTASPLHTARQGLIATQTVFHGRALPSRLRLPAMSRECFEEMRRNGAAWQEQEA